MLKSKKNIKVIFMQIKLKNLSDKRIKVILRVDPISIENRLLFDLL